LRVINIIIEKEKNKYGKKKTQINPHNWVGLEKQGKKGMNDIYYGFRFMR